MAESVKDVTTKFSKLDKFESVDFHRWQKKMHFLLTTLKVVYELSTLIPEYVEDETVEQTRRRNKWKNDDYICRGHILNGMSDTLFNIYQNVESAKALWDALEAKYMAERCFKQEVHSSHLPIEESLSAQENDKPKGKDVVGSSSMNMVEDRRATKINDRKGKRKVNDNKHDDSNKKSKLTCWKYGKFSHFKRDCRVEAFYLQDDDVVWWIDSGATTHVCKDLGWFKVFQPMDDGSILHMKNESSAPVVGVGSVVLEFTSGKTINLSNMLVPNKRNKVTLYELWYKKKPNLNYLRIWGCRAVVRLPEPKKKNLGERDIDCIFIGYVEHSKAYRNEVSTLYPYCFNVEDDPKTFDESMKSQDVAFWKEAINDETDSIMGNNTWVLADLPSGCKPSGCKWIFKKKMRVDGTIEKFKARLVI
ncbi:UNVERIFIED_CONTAM: hypothetical protein Scaly_1905800 [Sesamum calycinum]|uniref:Zinc finger, CCHC-type n=1 Tax=Sesamum calycinum TaxID=2727403 RepID=A0AAW2NHJ6_9LAMI